ncbi:Uncharacterised protein [uncultured Clostridium sp.]|nr:hypothetical protein [uncultured Clostridium sp.]SCK04028.1 Uncharacterised protein [uncultured Clostridium sp.]
MKKGPMKNIKRKLHKGKVKGNLLVEMADDFMDLVTNAKLYKKLTKKK